MEINYNVSLLTKRLRLSPVVGAHAEHMFPILSDHKLYEYTGGHPPRSITDLELWFKALESRKSTDGSELWLTWLLLTMEGGIAIGYVQATIGSSQTDISWLVGSEWQGNGYATEAAAELVSWLVANKVGVISAHIHSGHLGSQKVARALGFHNSGRAEDGEMVWLL